MAALTKGAAARFPDQVAARYRRGDEWVEVTYAALWDDVAVGGPRADRPRRRAGRPRRHPLQHPLRVLGRRPGGVDRRRRRRAGVPVQLAHRVRVGARRLRRGRRDLRGRAARWPRSNRCGPGCPTSATSCSSTGESDVDDRPRPAAGRRARRRRRRARRPHRSRAGRGPLPHHLHLGHDRAAQGRGADEPGLRLRAGVGGRDGAVRPRRRRLPVPAAGARVRPARSTPTASRSARRSPTGAATRRRSSPSWDRSSRRCCRRCRASSRRCTRWRWAWCRRSGPTRWRRRSTSASGSATPTGGARRCRQPRRRRSQTADGEMFALVRGIFGGRITLAISGAAPIAPEILRVLLRRRRARVRGLGDDRDDVDRHAQPARRLQVRHHRPARRRRRHPHRRGRRDRDGRRRCCSRSTGTTPRPRPR